VEKKLTRRDFLKAGGGALAGAYVLTLAGCGGGGGGEGGGGSSSVALYHDKPDWDYKKMGELSQKDVGIRIKPNSYSDTTSFQQVIKSSLRSPEAPGIFTWWSGYRLDELAQQGGLEDLTSLWESQTGDGNLQAGIADNFSFEGKQYAVPNAVSYWPVFYNKRVFEENGLEPPGTWDELIAAADKLKQAGVTPFYATLDGRWPAFIWFEELLIRTDPDFYNGLMQGEESYTDPVVVDVMKEWKSMIDAGYFTKLDIPMDATAVGEFEQGNFAMMPIGTWFNNGMLDAGLKPGEDYDLFVLPNVNPDLNENVVVVETGALAIPVNAPDVDASKQVAEWWVSPKAASTWAKELGDIPVNPKAEAPSPMLDTLVSTVQDNDYRLMQRFWEATLPQIVEPAVDQLGRFMLNPDQYMDVLQTIEDLARREWGNQSQ
jgi:multiple sugar transport system substrate-binding protein